MMTDFLSKPKINCKIPLFFFTGAGKTLGTEDSFDCVHSKDFIYLHDIFENDGEEE